MVWKAVSQIIASRKFISPTQLAAAVTDALKLSIADKNQAAYLVAIPNRVLQTAHKYDPDLFMSFYKKYEDKTEFINQFWENISDDGQRFLRNKGYSAPGSMPQKEAPPVIDERADRTAIMLRHNKKLEKDKEGYVYPYLGKRYKVTNRHTRDFNCPLIYPGAGTREDILLDVESLILRRHYLELVVQLRELDALSDKLNLLFEYTRRKVFPSGNVELLEKKNEVVPLSRFIDEGVGVCRHEALFVAYILSRLSQEKPHILKGEVSLYRTMLSDDAHAWVIFKSEEGAVYNVDTSRSSVKKGIILLSPETLPSLDNIYHTPGISDRLKERYGQSYFLSSKPPEEKPEALEPHDKAKARFDREWRNPGRDGFFKRIILPEDVLKDFFEGGNRFNEIPFPAFDFR